MATDPRGDDPARRRDVEGLFGRYRAVIDDWPAFVEALFTRPDAVVWANPLRLDRAELARLFAHAGMASSPLAWDPWSLRLAGVERPGLHWGHWAGLYYVQEEASILPARMLAPRPGERVLDLCAAPGSKTTRLALALENRGTLIANDRNVQRTAAISAAIARLGLVNVTITVGDGSTYPLETGPFDAILVDAPCSAEGAASKNAAWRTPDPDFRAFVVGTQRALLRRAIQLCRAGGRIVYSTCTFAPEENEAVLDAILREHEGLVRVVPFEPIEGLRTSAPLDEWNGKRFVPEVAGAVRLWPHVSGTGGFFAVRLEKLGASDDRVPAARSVREWGIDPTQSENLQRFIAMFGLGEDTFVGHRLLTEGRLARLVADDHEVPIGPRLVSTGLPVTRNRAHTAKLSTAGGLAFGRRATQRVVELDAAGTAAFQAREVVALPAGAPRGYVIARREGHPLGLGLVREHDGHAQLHSELPTGWSRSASGRSE
jgi:NOL1/NOP2/sun family putative RNA methylase